MQTDDKQHRSILQRIARSAMLDRGLLPDFSGEVLAELGRIRAPAAINDEQIRDLRDLLWASIDNDDSRDLDQLTVKGRHLTNTPAIILPLFIPPAGYSRCFPKSFPPTSHP